MRFDFQKLNLKKRGLKANKNLVGRTRFLNRRVIATALYLASALGMAFAIGVSVGEYSLNKRLAAQADVIARHSSQPGSPQSSAAPSTVKPSTNLTDSYTVAPDMPRYIIIPKIGVKTRVLAVGLTKDGAVGTPNNVYDTAWYSGSAKPGQPGAALIDGHVAGWNTKGVFYNLTKLQGGDRFAVELGNGTQLSYRIVKTATYDATNVDMGAVLAPVDPSAPGLNLITCGGSVTPGTNEFDRRIVVFATQI
jgi:LPXTG-site transpeptidase (sortase) family protein